MIAPEGPVAGDPQQAPVDGPPVDLYLAPPEPSLLAKVLGFTLIYLAVLVGLGLLPLHVWTACLVAERWGWSWAIVSVLFPPFSELVVLAKCFSWGIWFYSLAILSSLLVLPALVTGLFALKPGKVRAVRASFVILLVFATCVGAFSYYCIDHYASPQPVTASPQEELEDVAVPAGGLGHDTVPVDASDTAALPA